jgi:hypothetical protein
LLQLVDKLVTSLLRTHLVERSWVRGCLLTSCEFFTCVDDIPQPPSQERYRTWTLEVACSGFLSSRTRINLGKRSEIPFSESTYETIWQIRSILKWNQTRRISLVCLMAQTIENCTYNPSSRFVNGRNWQVGTFYFPNLKKQRENSVNALTKFVGAPISSHRECWQSGLGMQFSFFLFKNTL